VLEGKGSISPEILVRNEKEIFLVDSFYLFSFCCWYF